MSLDIALDLIADLQAIGIHFRSRDSQLWIGPTRLVTPEHLERLRGAKEDVLLMLNLAGDDLEVEPRCGWGEEVES